MESSIETTVAQAQNGSKDALEQVIMYAQGYIYNLSLRMLQQPAEAEDATQEILIKLITHLGQFRGERAFSTWMYRIATNTLLNMRVREREKHMSFDGLSLRLQESIAHYEESAEEVVESEELTEEVKRSCTLGMLLCLNREDRIALMLGEVVGVNSDDGAYIMESTPTAYRKRLSRARQTLVEFVSRQCGLVNAESPCRCHKHVRNKIRAQQLDPQQLCYAQPHDDQSTLEASRVSQTDLDAMNRTIALMRSHPVYAGQTDYRDMLKTLLSAGNPDL